MKIIEILIKAFFIGLILFTGFALVARETAILINSFAQNQ